MTRCDLAARSIWKSHQSGVKKILRSARRHRARIKSFISYGCWEWTQRGGRWITVESGADDTMKGSDRSRRDSEDESLRHGRMSAGNPDEARQVKLGLAIRAAVKSRMLRKLFLHGCCRSKTNTHFCKSRARAERNDARRLHSLVPMSLCADTQENSSKFCTFVHSCFGVRCASLCRRDGGVHFALSTGKGVSRSKERCCVVVRPTRTKYERPWS